MLRRRLGWAAMFKSGQASSAALSEAKLVCPADGQPLDALVGVLTCPACGARYPLVDGIARFVGSAIADTQQDQVRRGFAFKWSRGAWGFAAEHRELMWRFFCDRFGFAGTEDVARMFGGRSVLHAGIGNGQAEQHYLPHCRDVWGADISASVDSCRANWAEHYPDLAGRLHLCQADLMALPFADGRFDIVLSDGVLHHTPDSFAALRAIVSKVRPGGLVMFYVYRKKPPIREFVDDFVRSKISDLPPDQAWAALGPLTALARQLSQQSVTITVPDDIDILGISKGSQDLQRWLYWNVMKFYWNEALSFDDNNHVNFDWYYPKYAWRHEPEEVRGWLSTLGLKEIWFNPSESGLSVIAERPHHPV